MGGVCKQAHDVHNPSPTFQQGLAQFIKNSKAYIKIAGTPATKQAVQAYQGSELLMRRMGIFIRAPAIKAALCVASGLNYMIHDMLINIRKAKGENGKDMLKGSCLPLPKHEPWNGTLRKILEARAASGSTSIPSIAQRKRIKAKDGITLKGQLGDGRDLRTAQLFLTCPKCNAAKNVASCTLYGDNARVVHCAACKASSSSSRWACSHSIPWLSCPIHREAGFRCAGSRKAQHPSPTLLARESKIKARLRRLKRLGNLGSKDSPNSTSSAQVPKQKRKEHKKHIEYMKPPREGARTAVGLALMLRQTQHMPFLFLGQTIKRPGLLLIPVACISVTLATAILVFWVATPWTIAPRWCQDASPEFRGHANRLAGVSTSSVSLVMVLHDNLSRFFLLLL